MPLHPSVERYLHAVFPDYRMLDQVGYAAHARDAARLAFPALTLPLDFVYLHSRRRSFEQQVIEGRGVVFADRGLSELIGLLDFVAMQPALPSDAAPAVLHVPFTEAFRHRADPLRALVCAQACLDHRDLIAAVRNAAFAARAGHSALGLVLLLHEIAHFLIDQHDPSVVWLEERVARELAAHGDIVMGQRERLQAGDVLPELRSDIAAMSMDDRKRLSEQMGEMVAHVRTNSETARETCCDSLAILGLLTLYFGEELLDPKMPPPKSASLRQACDAVFLGIRLSRQLIAKAFLTQTADNICDGVNPSILGTSFSRMTARQNVGTTIALGLVEGLIEKWREFGMMSAGERDYLKHFEESVTALDDRSASRIMQGIEDIGLFNRDSHLYPAERTAMVRRLFGKRAPSLRKQYEALDAYLARLPF